MAKAAGRRPDETSSEQSQRQGPETWALALVAALMALAIIALVVFAGH
jgi:hypothetical protein